MNCLHAKLSSCLRCGPKYSKSYFHSRAIQVIHAFFFFFLENELKSNGDLLEVILSNLEALLIQDIPL